MTARRRPSRTLVLVALVLAGAAGIAYAFRRELRYGRVAPPTPNYDALEPAVALRVRQRTAAVLAHPYSAEAWGMLAVAYDVHESFANGIACYERAATLDPADFRWPYFLGLSMRQGDRESALVHLRRAATLNPGYAPVHFYIGDALLQAPDLDGAGVEFERAIALDPAPVAPRLGLAKIALARSDGAAALRHLNDALALQSITGEIQALFVEACRLTGDSAGQAEHARLASERFGIEPMLDPLRAALLMQERVSLQARRARGERYLQEGRADLATAELRQAVSDAPDSAAAHIALADLFSRAGRNDDAIVEYERAVKLAPDDAGAQNGLGGAYGRAQRVEAAVAAFERALVLDPNLQKARNNLGMLLAQTGRADRGIELLAESCKAMPNDVGAHINWASTLKAAGRLEEATQVYRTVTRLEPTLVRAHFELGLTLAQLGRPAEAVDEFRQVVAAEPARATGHSNLARALRLTGRDADCIAACRAGLQAVPGEPFLQNCLAWTLCSAADPELRNGAEALAIARRLCDASKRQDPDALQILAAAHAETGDFASATQCADEALAIFRAHTEKPGVQEAIAELERCRALYAAGQSYRKAP